LLASPSAALAHDPGLSVLDIRLESGRVIAALALAAADARIPLELQSIDLALDGVPLQGRVEQRGPCREESSSVAATRRTVSGSSSPSSVSPEIA
jgi:hypothetical protein